jgi:hypothetical protein
MSQRRTTLNILDAVGDVQVFGQHFGGSSWDVWKVFLAALFALPMTDAQLALYRQYTGRQHAPTHPFTEAWLICGRRAGKSFILAVIAVFLACFRDWRRFLGPGEFGTIMVVAEDRAQSRAIMRFIGGLLRASPMLARTIINETAESYTLRGNVIIEVHTASWRSTRGYTVLAGLADEIAIWPTDENSSDPDVEIINSIKHGMATIPGAMLLCASSPHAQRGALWQAYREHYGRDDSDVLVWKAPTREMNSTVPQAFIDAQLEKDHARASADYLAEFRSDLEGFVARAAVEACVMPGLRELPPSLDCFYRAFCDPSGGSSDSMVLAIAHNDLQRHVVVLDCVREVKAPFSPEQVVAEFSTLLKSYRIYSLSGDHYAKLWPVEMFARYHQQYAQDARPKSDLYAGLLPLINSRRIELLDLPVLINQTCGLERSTRQGAGEKIDHPPHGKDDVVNAVAGVAAMCARDGGYDTTYRAFRSVPDSADGPASADRRLASLYGAIYNGIRWGAFR